MNHSDVRDHTYRWGCDPAEQINFSGNIKSHLQNCLFRLLVRMQQSQRKTDFIIHVARCLQRTVMPGKDIIDQFLCGSLSDAPRDSEHFHFRKLCPVISSCFLQCSQGVFHTEADRFFHDIRSDITLPVPQIDHVKITGHIFLYQCRAGTFFECGRNKFVTVSPFSGHGSKQNSFSSQPGIDNSFTEGIIFRY